MVEWGMTSDNMMKGNMMNSEYNDSIRSVPFGMQYQYVDNHSEKDVVLTDFVNVEIPLILFYFPGDQQAIPVVNDGTDSALPSRSIPLV